MKILDLRKELVVKYGEQFDSSKGWCDKLLNTRNMEDKEKSILLYYLRSYFYANFNFAKLISVIRMNRQDALLLSLADKRLPGEILVNYAGEDRIIGGSKYVDETGKYYWPDEIMMMGLYLAIENENEKVWIFGRSCRSEKLVRQNMQEKKESTIVLIAEHRRPDYYIISSRLLLSKKRQGEKKAEVGNLTRWGSNISY